MARLLYQAKRCCPDWNDRHHFRWVSGLQASSIRTRHDTLEEIPNTVDERTLIPVLSAYQTSLKEHPEESNFRQAILEKFGKYEHPAVEQCLFDLVFEEPSRLAYLSSRLYFEGRPALLQRLSDARERLCAAKQIEHQRSIARLHDLLDCRAPEELKRKAPAPA